MDRRDLQELRAQVSIVEIIGATVQLKRRGREYWASCPLHGSDSTPSFHVRPEQRDWRCFGCGAGGDVFDWLQQAEGLSFKEAIQRLEGGNAPKRVNGHKNGHEHTPTPKPVPAVIMPMPSDAPEATLEHPRLGLPAMHWAYRSADGALLGYVCRFNTKGGGKEVLPRVYTAQGWRWQGFPKPRPLYGLDQLAARPDAPVLVVEGEKAASAAAELCPNHVVVTWCGGTAAVEYADWAPLQGRQCLIWPDSDPPGEKAAAAIRKILGDAAKVVHPPEGVEKSWDAWDARAAGWDWAKIQDWWLEKRIGEPHVLRPPVPRPKPAPQPAPDDYGASEQTIDEAPPEDEDDRPFRIVGHYQGNYYFVPRAGGTVIRLSGSSLSKHSLLMLAPLTWWQTQMGCTSTAGWDAAANALIQQSYQFGVYDPWKFRGRGAWLDKGRVVIHLGNKLLVDGAETRLDAIESEFFYERGRTLRFAQAEPMQSRNAVRLLDLCKMLSWENTLSAYLLAGAIAGAPICGALEWRPHIWICAPGGSGKTWIAENIIAPTIGPMLVNCAAKTTEPGVRRRLASDAFPVMIDEFEANDPMQMARCTSMMGLARSSSRETSAEILQGSTSGSSESFRVRSSFIFLSIGMSAHEYADLTRISVLTLRKNDATKQGIDHFNRIQDFRRELLTPEWIDSLHARMVSLIPIIRHNAEVFALAGAKIMGTRRLGDQIGALLANAYALVASSRVTPEVAAAWIERQDWREEREILHDMDGVHCFSRIMEHKVSVDGPHTTLRRSLGELVDAILDRGEYDAKLTKSEASATLRRYGVAVQPDKTLAISNTHSAIADILRGTPWAVNWARRLKQIDGAESYDGVLSFAGAKTRAVLIPTQA